MHLLSTDFLKLTFSDFFSGTLWECQKVWFQVRSDILLGLNCLHVGQIGIILFPTYSNLNETITAALADKLFVEKLPSGLRSCLLTS